MKVVKGEMRFGMTFGVLLASWVLLSGQLDPWHLSWGVACSALVAYLSRELLLPSPLQRDDLYKGVRFLGYLPWLLKQILLANLHMAQLVLHPRMERLIDPRIIRFRTCLTGDMARVTFANSITLTPGTITVYVDEREGIFYVHAIDRQVAEALPGEMEKRVAAVYGEGR